MPRITIQSRSGSAYLNSAVAAASRRPIRDGFDVLACALQAHPVKLNQNGHISVISRTADLRARAPAAHKPSVQAIRRRALKGNVWRNYEPWLGHLKDGLGDALIC